MKPKYIRDLLTNQLYEFPADDIPKLIGRAPECYIKTPANDTSVSRNQAKIRHRKDGVLLITQETQHSPTWIGDEDQPYKLQVLYGNTEQIFFRDIIIVGTKQRFRLENFTAFEDEKTRRKTQDTNPAIKLDKLE